MAAWSVRESRSTPARLATSIPIPSTAVTTTLDYQTVVLANLFLAFTPRSDDLDDQEDDELAPAPYGSTASNVGAAFAVVAAQKRRPGHTRKRRSGLGPIHLARSRRSPATPFWYLSSSAGFGPSTTSPAAPARISSTARHTSARARRRSSSHSSSRRRSTDVTSTSTLTPAARMVASTARSSRARSPLQAR